MANETLLRGSCPPPFYDAGSFGMGGYAAGRFCAPVPQIQEGLVCCLPCPSTDYLYPQCKETPSLNRDLRLLTLYYSIQDMVQSCRRS
jgi:hypothetical protein